MPSNRRRDIPRSSKRAMFHALSVPTHHAPLHRKHVRLFVCRQRRMTSGADRGTARRGQRHAGREFAQTGEHERGNEDQADDES